MKLPLLYEDDYLLAVNKPTGLLTVPATNIPVEKTVLGIIQMMFASRGVKPYVLHRLDRGTSGILLFGKFPRDRQLLEEIFKGQKTQKRYWALVQGHLKDREGIIRGKIQARHSPTLVESESHYRVIRKFPPCSLLEVEISTGRKHQIRKHLASIGHPVVLDPLYGDHRFNKKFRAIFGFQRIALHAESISFIHPFTKKPLEIRAPLPKELTLLMEKLIRTR